MIFDQWLEGVLRKRTQKRFYTRIKDDHVVDDRYDPLEIAPNSDYFELRLTEMYIQYSREYWRTFVPLAMVASEFIYDGDKRSFPFLVANDLMQNIDKYTKGNDIRFHNTKAVGPVPYCGGDVAVFVGLYRAEVDDFAKKLLGVLGKVVDVFDFSKQLSGYVDIAKELTDGLYAILNFNQLEYRLGDRDVFQDHGMSPLRGGFLVYANCDSTAVTDKEHLSIKDSLWVEDRTLKIGPSRDALRLFDDCDYCLLHVDRSVRRNDWTSLPFHKKWLEAKEGISNGDNGLAQTLFIKCCDQIQESPDLTRADAQHVILAYQADYAQSMQFYAQLKTPAVPPAYRGADGAKPTPQQGINNTIQFARNAGVKDSLQGLVALRDNWDAMPQLASKDSELTNEFLSRQVEAIAAFSKGLTPDPRGLAKAIAVASVTAS